MDYREVKFDESQPNSSRDKFARNIRGNVNFEFTKNGDPWDVSSTGLTDDGSIAFTANSELKDRDIPYTLYERSGYMIEKMKYTPLLQAYRETGSIPYLIIYFQDGKGWSCNLLKINGENIKWKWRLCTKTTAEGTYNNEKVWKLVYDIPPSKGRFFDYV